MKIRLKGLLECKRVKDGIKYLTLRNNKNIDEETTINKPPRISRLLASIETSESLLRERGIGF